jgi:hypothetical protein
VSNLDKDGNRSDTLPEHGNYFWHTDKSYHDVPSLLTMLHAVVLPPSGGPTQFANTKRAYAALPEATKLRIDGLRTVHSWEASRIKSGSTPATEEQKCERPRCIIRSSEPIPCAERSRYIWAIIRRISSAWAKPPAANCWPIWRRMQRVRSSSIPTIGARAIW